MSCGEFPDKPLCHFHLLEWMRRLCASLRFSSRSFPHLLATNYSTAQLRLLDIVHADQKLYLVFEFLDVDLKRYIETGNQNGKPITAPIVKVSPNSMRFGLSPFLPVWPGFVPVIARRVLSRLFIRILSSLHDTSSLFHFVHLGRAFARGRDAYMAGYCMNPTELLSQNKNRRMYASSPHAYSVPYHFHRRVVQMWPLCHVTLISAFRRVPLSIPILVFPFPYEKEHLLKHTQIMQTEIHSPTYFGPAVLPRSSYPPPGPQAAEFAD